MKISDKISELFSVKNQSVAKGGNNAAREYEQSVEQGAVSAEAGKDKVTISAAAQNLRLAKAALDEDQKLSEARKDDLRQRIANGTYSVSSDDIAQSLVDFFKREGA